MSSLTAISSINFNRRDNLRFGRAFNKRDWRGYQQLIHDIKKLPEEERIVKEQTALVVPIGSLSSSSLLGDTKFFQFANKLGFDTFQFLPWGDSGLDRSPYQGSPRSINPVYAHLEPLVNDAKWCGILGKETIEKIDNHLEKLTKEKPETANRLQYEYLYNAKTEAFEKAYEKFEEKLMNSSYKTAGKSILSFFHIGNNKGEQLNALNERFKKFKEERSWLEPLALYKALSKEHGNSYWKNWPKLDRDLFEPTQEDSAYNIEYHKNEIRKKYRTLIESYLFSQFYLHEEHKKFKEFAKDNNLSLMSDLPIGLSNTDYWSNRSLFVNGLAMGCPPDYFSKYGQTWGFYVYDPDQLFNPDGTLGKAGKYLYSLHSQYAEDWPGGYRIDHIIGPFNPWVYKEGASSTSPENGGARLHSSPELDHLKGYSHVPLEAIDFTKSPDNAERIKPEYLTKGVIDSFARILDKIILPAIGEKGLDKNNLLCEDLGTVPNIVHKIMKERQLSGIAVTQFVEPEKANHIYRGRQVPKRCWITPGTHDCTSTWVWIKELFADPWQVHLHAKQLAKDLIPDSFRRRRELQERIEKDPLEFAQAKFAETFANQAQKGQIFFTDLFGMEDRYNYPGTSHDAEDPAKRHDNWTLKIQKDYEKFYFEQVQKKKALNIPESLKMAMEAKGSKFVKQHQNIYNRLDYYSRILQEPEKN